MQDCMHDPYNVLHIIMQRINQKNMILWRKGRKHCYITMENCLRKGSVNVIFHILMYSTTSCTIFLLSTTHIFYLMQWRCNLAGRCMLTLKKKTWLDYDSSKENEIRDCTVNVFRIASGYNWIPFWYIWTSTCQKSGKKIEWSLSCDGTSDQLLFIPHHKRHVRLQCVCACECLSVCHIIQFPLCILPSLFFASRFIGK